MNISKTLIFENRAQYLKAIIIKIFLSLLVAKLFTYQGTFLDTVFLNYFAFSMFYFSLRIAKNYLIAVILLLGICIAIMLTNEYLHNEYSVEASNLFFMVFALFPFIYDLFIILWVTIKKIKLSQS
ncbi:hypothetical protein J9537_10555 [Enterococcus raffinosus]|uniref:hypothetical protein n=1 Tax=Enterococcus raffinosus TaxID=71452 RepID=UPI001C491263|nr:hypothetical protein [Enterococcus raffinosus]QXJ58459.1 hypothetical protein J9537_10555 [Enterococcus raffinosus]